MPVKIIQIDAGIVEARANKFLANLELYRTSICTDKDKGMKAFNVARDFDLIQGCYSHNLRKPLVGTILDNINRVNNDNISRSFHVEYDKSVRDRIAKTCSIRLADTKAKSPIEKMVHDAKAAEILTDFIRICQYTSRESARIDNRYFPVEMMETMLKRLPVLIDKTPEKTVVAFPRGKRTVQP